MRGSELPYRNRRQERYDREREWIGQGQPEPDPAMFPHRILFWEGVGQADKARAKYYRTQGEAIRAANEMRMWRFFAVAQFYNFAERKWIG